MAEPLDWQNGQHSSVGAYQMADVRITRTFTGESWADSCEHIAMARAIGILDVSQAPVLVDTLDDGLQVLAYSEASYCPACMQARQIDEFDTCLWCGADMAGDCEDVYLDDNRAGMCVLARAAIAAHMLTRPVCEVAA